MVFLKKIKTHGASDFFILLQIAVLLTYCLLEFSSVKSTFWINRDIQKKLGEYFSHILYFEVHDETDPAEFKACKEALLETGKYESICTYHNKTIVQSNGIDEIELLELSAGIESIMSPDIAQGRFFEADDYRHEEKVVVIGPDLAEAFHLQLGDRLEEHGIDMTGTVIGILKKGQSWFFQNVLEAQSILLDNQILVPADENKTYLTYYGILSPESDKEMVIKEAQQIIAKQGLVMSAADLEKELQEQWDNTQSDNIQWIAFTIVILLMIAIGTALVVYARIYQQKKEIGIFMAMGYSHKKILGFQAGEIGLVGILGYVAAVITARLLIGNGRSELGGLIIYTGNSLDLSLILIDLLILILVAAPSLLIMIFGILALQPVDLIGGKEK